MTTIKLLTFPVQPTQVQTPASVMGGHAAFQVGNPSFEMGDPIPIEVQEPKGIRRNTYAYWKDIFSKKLTTEQLGAHALFRYRTTMKELEVMAERVSAVNVYGAGVFKGQGSWCISAWNQLDMDFHLGVLYKNNMDNLVLRVREQALADTISFKSAIDFSLREHLELLFQTHLYASRIMKKGVPAGVGPERIHGIMHPDLVDALSDAVAEAQGRKREDSVVDPDSEIDSYEIDPVERTVDFKSSK